MTIVVHGSALSPFTRKVTFALLEKQVSFSFEDLNPYNPPRNFKTLNPLQKIPILQNGDYTLADSSAILGYLDAAFSDQLCLMPKDANMVGQALWIEEYADTELFQTISEGVFNPVYINLYKGVSIDKARIKHTIKNQLPIPLGYLEQQLRGKKWFAGDAISRADVAVYAQLINLQHCQQWLSSATYPNLSALFEKMQSFNGAKSQRESEKQYLHLMMQQLKIDPNALIELNLAD